MKFCKECSAVAANNMKCNHCGSTIFVNSVAEIPQEAIEKTTAELNEKSSHPMNWLSILNQIEKAQDIRKKQEETLRKAYREAILDVDENAK